MSSKKPIIQPKKKVSRKPASPELLYYGEHICQKLAERRQGDIIRVYCTEELMPKFKPLLQWCAANRKAYHIVSGKDLEKITSSVHHEGVAILAKQKVHGNLDELEKALQSKPNTPLLYLDGVQNPHNIGTIMRVMASFGWPYVVGPQTMVPLSSAGARMSEGGAEFVEVFAAETGLKFFVWAKEKGYTIFGTSSHESKSLYDIKLPAKAIFVLGHEVHGMTKELEKKVDVRLAIPATAQVESLNVAVATGILVAEYTRQHGLISSK
ncbi:MAG: hypothetical protein EOP10_15025 [Proteobacteria bacterium]|nr:MAG: hypothetical protein EOP10_15025 [Pseudomonadota bacterium]